MGQIISSDDYPSVRAALDITLDTTTLPDSLIALPIFEGVAETDVMAEDTQWQLHVANTDVNGNVDPAIGQHLRNAVIYHCAALLALSMADNVDSEALPGGGYRYTRSRIDWEERHKHLDSQADRELEALIAVNQPDTGAMPTMFTLGFGGRARGPSWDAAKRSFGARRTEMLVSRAQLKDWVAGWRAPWQRTTVGPDEAVRRLLCAVVLRAYLDARLGYDPDAEAWMDQVAPWVATAYLGNKHVAEMLPEWRCGCRNARAIRMVM